MRKTILAVLLLIAAPLVAQQVPAPDLTTALAAIVNSIGAMTQNITNLWAAMGQQQQLTSNLPQDEANISTLQHQVADLQSQLIALKAAPPPPPSSGPQAYLLTNLPLGPISVSDNDTPPDGIDWGTGQWAATSSGVAPAVQGTSRFFVLPAGKTLLFFTATGSGPVTLTDTTPGTTNQQVTITLNATPISSPTGWTHTTGPIQVSTGFNATNMRLLSVTF